MARTDNLEHFLTDVADAIRDKTGSQETISANSFDTAIENIPSGGSTRQDVIEKDVNYYDIDGTRLFSYTKEEFALLENHPTLVLDNEVHDNLTFYQWNWDFQKAKDYVATYGGVDIGAQFNTVDDCNYIYLYIDEFNSNIKLTLQSNTDITVNWGDGSTGIISASSSQPGNFITHNYTTYGVQKIKISSESNIMVYSNWVLENNDSSNYNEFSRMNVKSNIKRIYIKNLYFTTNSLSSIYCDYMVFNNFDWSYNRPYASYLGFKIFIVPRGAGLGASSFGSTTRCIRLVCNDSDTTFVNGFFTYGLGNLYTNLTSGNSIHPQSTYSYMSKIVIHERVQQIGYVSVNPISFACAKLIDLSHVKVVPSLECSELQINSETKIVVPDDLYEDFIVADVWSTVAGNIISKSDYDNL